MRIKKYLLCLTFMSALSLPVIADGWPEALADNTSTKVDTAASIRVLDNDVGNSLTLTSVNDWTVEGGRASINEDKLTITYTPKAGFTGNDSFWYVFSDNQGRTNAAKVTVNVTATSDPAERPAEWPVAIIDNVDVTNTTPISISVLENDIGVGLTITSVNEYSANGGKIIINDDKLSVTYESLRPRSEWPYVDEFWYVLTDSWGRTNAAKVTVKLDQATAPEASPQSNTDNANTFINTPVTINVLSNDVGEGLNITTVNESSVQWGRITIQGDSVVYTPRYDFTGTDEFWYDFKDAWGRASSAKVIVNVTARQVVPQVPLNDTGLVTCGNYTGVESSESSNPANSSSNDLQDCAAGTDSAGNEIPANQDATTGRDVTHNDDSDGDAGFSFTKLDASGNPLDASAASWSCVKDNVTGMIWEAKQGLGSGVGAAGLHSADDTYYWYTTDPTLEAGVTQTPDSYSSYRADTVLCFGDAANTDSTYCSAESFVNRVNSEGLCGINNWRLPSPPELTSLVNFNSRAQLFDKTFFPNTNIGSASYGTNTIVRRNAGDEPIRAGVDFSLNLFLYPFYAVPINRPTYLRLVTHEEVGE